MFHFQLCSTHPTDPTQPFDPPRFSTLPKSSFSACDSDEYIFVAVSSLARPRKNYSRRVVIPHRGKNKVHVFPVHDKKAALVLLGTAEIPSLASFEHEAQGLRALFDR